MVAFDLNRNYDWMRGLDLVFTHSWVNCEKMKPVISRLILLNWSLFFQKSNKNDILLEAILNL